LLLLFVASDPPMKILERGLVALQHGDLRQARAAFEEVAKEDPHNAFAWASLAETYAELKQPKAAADAALKAEKYGGDNPVVSHALAIYFTKAGQLRHAAELEQKYASSGHADAEAGLRVASLFLEGGDVPEAVAAARKAAAEHPSAQAEDLLGRALLASNQSAEGLPHLEAAWQAAKTDPQFVFHYAEALLRREDFNKASAVLSAGLEAHPDDPQLVLAVGVARYGQRRFDDAIAAFLRVIRIDPRAEQPYGFLGRMLDQAGTHLPEIIADYEKWSARNPKNAEGWLLLAKARLASDAKDSSAEGLLRRSISLGGGNWEAHYELGVLLEGKHNWAGAAAELKRSAELDPRQAEPHYHLARVYDRLGNAEGAKAERAIHERLTGGAK
jgi:tetratricopeptide (TPR) repeat protein